MRAAALVTLIATAGLAPASRAEGPVELAIRIKDHRFEPAELRVPAGRRILLRVRNEDATSEEFDSTSLKVEKVIAANSEGIVRIGALDPGRYDFIGEYHDDTARGVVIAE